MIGEIEQKYLIQRFRDGSRFDIEYGWNNCCRTWPESMKEHLRFIAKNKPGQYRIVKHTEEVVLEMENA